MLDTVNAAFETSLIEVLDALLARIITELELITGTVQA